MPLPILKQALAFVPRVGGEPGSRRRPRSDGPRWWALDQCIQCPQGHSQGVRFLTPAV